MKQKDKELLLLLNKDLCARLPYHPIVYVNENLPRIKFGAATRVWEYIAVDKPCKPYLRSMSSMTEEEKEELLNRLPKYWNLEIDKLGDLYFDIRDASYPDIELLTNIIDWLNKKMFDYRGLIEKGLALEAPEGMYNLNK